MKSKQVKQTEAPSHKKIDYLELIKDSRFDFYGLFAYLNINFQNENIFDEILAQICFTQSNEQPDTRESLQILYKEQDFTWDHINVIELDKYPRCFSQHNFVDLSEEDIKNKIAQCRNFMKQYPINTIRSAYFYVIQVRCLLHQAIDAEQCLQIMVKRLYPWILFEALKVKGKKEEHILLYFNFLENILYEINSNTNIQQKSPFAQIDRVTYGFQQDEIIVSLQKQMIVYKARYVFQRAFIAEVFRFAHQKDTDLRLRAHYINPNNDNFIEEFQKQDQTFKNAQTSFFKLVNNDKILPPKMILTYRGLLISENEHLNNKIQNPKQKYISLGKNNILVHEYEQEVKFYGIIPISDQHIYIESTQNSKCFSNFKQYQGLGCHVGGAKYYLIFNTELETMNFSRALHAIRKQEIIVDTIYLNMPNRKTQKNSLKYKKHKLKEIQQKYEETQYQLELLSQTKCWLELQVTQGEFNNMPHQQFQKSDVKSPNLKQYNENKEKSNLQTVVKMIKQNTSQNSSDMISSKYYDNIDVNIFKQFQ